MEGGDQSCPGERQINISDIPETEPAQLLNVRTHIESALQNRSDLNQARLEIEKGEIEIVRTRNGLLPQLDLFLRLGGFLYTDSFSSSNDVDGTTTTLSAGLDFELPYKNREARALHDRSRLSLEQSRLALINMAQLIQVDVRSAYVDVNRMEEQINATRATRKALLSLYLLDGSLLSRKGIQIQ